MTAPCSLLVFSDLDGTLLDHANYDWCPAKPALDRLRDLGAGVVLASSKTAAEIAVLQEQMNLQDWPAIIENGAGLLGDADAQPDYDVIRQAIEAAPGRDQFRGFGDMTVDEVAAVTGLPLPDATRARQRQFSEPGLWTGDQADKQTFLAALLEKGVTAREGGRFLTLSQGKTKADQMAAIIARYRPQHTLALGDAPNDVEMLQAADHGVIIANPHRGPLPPLPGEANGQITRTKAAGPVGWNAAVLARLDRLKLTELDNTHG